MYSFREYLATHEPEPQYYTDHLFRHKYDASETRGVVELTVSSFNPTSAPLSTLLSNRFGHRPVVMIGGFLISLGNIVSAFTSSINDMYITIGLVSGNYQHTVTAPAELKGLLAVTTICPTSAKR